MENHVLDIWTIETTTVTSSSLPPTKVGYPAIWAASEKGLLADADLPTSCAFNAKISAISCEVEQNKNHLSTIIKLKQTQGTLLKFIPQI